jgi:hypothetical protein
MAHIFTLLVALFIFVFTPVHSDEVRLTVYDDGLSCPGNCDAHVVFHSALNGTQYAHHVETTPPPFRKCISGQTCQICFASGLKQCMDVMYRGDGPSKMTFDFTPSFYSENCPGTDSYPLLQEKCKELKAAEHALAGRINCIKDPNNDRCSQLISAAKAAKEIDAPLYQSCLLQGEKKFNTTQPKERQRSLGCAYEKHGTGGPNSKGTTWRKLLPAVCREGTFVGRDGLDCCNGIPFVDGPLGRECRSFYPQ